MLLLSLLFKAMLGLHPQTIRSTMNSSPWLRKYQYENMISPELRLWAGNCGFQQTVQTPYLAWEEGVSEVSSLVRNYFTAILPSPPPATQWLVQTPVQRGSLPFWWNRPHQVSTMVETQGGGQSLLFSGDTAQNSSCKCLYLGRIMLCSQWQSSFDP